jgi:GT2 family glycosyltransferase
MAVPHVVIVLLNWNNSHYTLPCLQSLAQIDYANAHIVVVDNGSTDGSPAVIRQQFPDVAILEQPRNLGFAAGNNVGLRWALERKADYVLLLNNDTDLAPDFLNLLVAAAERDPTIGIVAPTIYYYEQPQAIWSAGGHVDWSHGQTSMDGLDQ